MPSPRTQTDVERHESRHRCNGYRTGRLISGQQSGRHYEKGNSGTPHPDLPHMGFDDELHPTLNSERAFAQCIELTCKCADVQGKQKNRRQQKKQKLAANISPCGMQT